MTKDVERLLAIIARQERDLVFPSFANEDAYRIGTAIKAAADAAGRKLLISVRKNGRTVFLCAMDTITPMNEHWLERKIRTTELCRRSSYAVGLQQDLDGERFEDSGLDPSLYTGAGGCFPVVVEGCGFVGTIAVSGMEGWEDHQAVADAVGAHLGVSTASLLD